MHYDGIIIGAGPNGLCLGAYMARAGQKVLLLERRMEIGGGLATEQVTIPGFLHNTHAVYHAMVDYAPVFQDLRLMEDYGLRFIYPDPVMVMPMADGRSIALYQDVERSVASIQAISPRDAGAYREMYHRFQQYTDLFLAPATYERAQPAFETLAKLQSSPVGQEINEYSEKTPRQIVDEIFSEEHVRSLILYAACKWGLDYDLEGLGYLVPLMINRATSYRLCQGGSHRLSHVLSKFIYDHGGMILGSQLIKRIIVENETAKGVELEDGTFYRAGWVASTIDPYQTFLQYVGEDNLEAEFVGRIKDWQWEASSLFGVHLALREPPAFTAAANNPDLQRAFIYFVGCETEEELIRHWDAVKRGELTAGGFNCCFPSVHDPGQAPPGRHTGLLSQHAPYDLRQGGAEGWYRLRQEHADALLVTLRKYAPNMSGENILWRYISTPKDIENKFLDMRKGSYKQGGYYPLQMGYLRPNEYCSRHLTPVRRLYLCGASSFSGGLVVFGPGYNGANAIAEDLGLDKWWPEPASVTRAKEMGLL